MDNVNMILSENKQKVVKFVNVALSYLITIRCYCGSHDIIECTITYPNPFPLGQRHTKRTQSNEEQIEDHHQESLQKALIKLEAPSSC